MSGQALRPARTEMTATYKLDTLDKCEVHLDSLFDALYIKNIKNSKINIGPVKSSVFVDNCENCELQIMGHQIRIHNCTSTKFCIFTPTKCIIENCSKLLFTKYSYGYEGFADDFKSCEYKD